VACSGNRGGGFRESYGEVQECCLRKVRRVTESESGRRLKSEMWRSLSAENWSLPQDCPGI
jgi:hypothetical protein